MQKQPAERWWIERITRLHQCLWLLTHQNTSVYKQSMNLKKRRKKNQKKKKKKRQSYGECAGDRDVSTIPI